MAPKVVIVMADYGNDPTEVATPFSTFLEAGFEVSFATETGKVPSCDNRMLNGVTAALLGATRLAKNQHESMCRSTEYNTPLSWSSADFDLRSFDLVFLPGGHDKEMRQYIESQTLHKQLAHYVKEIRAGAPDKSLVAICHGVQVLAAARDESGKKSIIHDFETTALPGFMEQSIYWVTSPFLGAYYKTYGPGTPAVEEIVRSNLDNPASQWKSAWTSQPFTHRDPNFRYISARFPPDAARLASEAVGMVTHTL